MPSFKKPDFHPNFPEKNIIVSDTQDSFGMGAIKEEYWGRSTTEEFRKGVKVLQNFDIQEQNTLVKRSGAVEDTLMDDEVFTVGDQPLEPTFREQFMLPDLTDDDSPDFDTFRETRHVKDYKYSKFKDFFVAVACVTIRRRFFVKDKEEGDSGYVEPQEFERNVIHAYAGYSSFLPFFRQNIPGTGNLKDIFISGSEKYSSDRGVLGQQFFSGRFGNDDSKEAYGLVLSFLKSGGSELSTKGISIESVNKNTAMVISSFTHPVAITQDEQGLALRWLGFPGYSMERRGPSEREAVFRDLRFEVKQSRYYEMGFQLERFSRDGIATHGGVVFHNLRYDDIGNAAVYLNDSEVAARIQTLKSRPVPGSLIGERTRAVTREIFEALEESRPAWAKARTVVEEYDRNFPVVDTYRTRKTRQGFTYTQASRYQIVGDTLRRGSGLLRPMWETVANDTSDGGDYITFTLKESLKDIKPDASELEGFGVGSSFGEVPDNTELSEDGGPIRSGFAYPPLVSLSAKEGEGMGDKVTSTGSVLAFMDEDIFNNCIFDDRLKIGYLMVYLEEISESGGNALVVGGSAKLCEVRPYHDIERFCERLIYNGPTPRYPNVVLTFFTKSFLEASEGYSNLAHLGFEDIKSIYWSLIKPLNIRQFSYPGYSIGRGFPSSVTKVDARTILAGFGNNRIMFGTVGSPAAPALGFSGLIPDEFKFSADDVKKIADGEVDAIRPSSQASPDDVFYFNTQLTSTTSSILPFEMEAVIGTNNEIFWADTIRNLILGSKVEETLVRTVQNTPLAPGVIDLRGFQSARGSGSHLTAKGDYSLFFVGPDRDEIYFFWYDDAISGLRTRSATVMGGDLKDIQDMRWDYRRKALWVVHGDGLLSLFYLSKEYGIMGWSDYIFDDPENGIFESRYKAHGLFHNEDLSVGFTAKGGKMVRLPFDRGDGEYITEAGVLRDIPYMDAGDKAIVSRVEFFRNPPQSKSGPATIWKKRQGVCDLLCRDITEIYSGGSSRKENRKDLTVNTQVVSDLGVYTYSLQGKESSILRDKKLLFVSVEHRKAERAEILSVSGRYEILEV